MPLDRVAPNKRGKFHLASNGLNGISIRNNAVKRLIFLFICVSFFISCEPSSDLVYPVKPQPKTEFAESDTVKMQYQINTSLVHAQMYLVFADYGNGYLYQCIVESVYNPVDDTADNLRWTFLKSQMTSDIAKFKIIAHWDNQPQRDIQLGIIYFSNVHK